ALVYSRPPKVDGLDVLVAQLAGQRGGQLRGRPTPRIVLVALAFEHDKAPVFFEDFFEGRVARRALEFASLPIRFGAIGHNERSPFVLDACKAAGVVLVVTNGLDRRPWIAASRQQ